MVGIRRGQTAELSLDNVTWTWLMDSRDTSEKKKREKKGRGEKTQNRKRTRLITAPLTACFMLSLLRSRFSTLMSSFTGKSLH